MNGNWSQQLQTMPSLDLTDKREEKKITRGAQQYMQGQGTIFYNLIGPCLRAMEKDVEREVKKKKKQARKGITY